MLGLSGLIETVAKAGMVCKKFLGQTTLASRIETVAGIALLGPGVVVGMGENCGESWGQVTEFTWT